MPFPASHVFPAAAGPLKGGAVPAPSLTLRPLRIPTSHHVWQDLLVPRPSTLRSLRDWALLAHMSVDEVAILVKVERMPEIVCV